MFVRAHLEWLTGNERGGPFGFQFSAEHFQRRNEIDLSVAGGAVEQPGLARRKLQWRRAREGCQVRFQKRKQRLALYRRQCEVRRFRVFIMLLRETTFGFLRHLRESDGAELI